MDTTQLLQLVAEARRRGCYEDDPRWDEVDAGLRSLGFDMTETIED